MHSEGISKSGLPIVTAEVVKALEKRLGLDLEAGSAEREALAAAEILRAENPHLYQVLNHYLNRMESDGFRIGVPQAALLTYEALRMEAARRPPML